MPWEKAFDEDKAVEQAMRVFWQKGYDSTSITDLIEGTGVNRGSLYNAFGGKRALFVQTLQRYDRDRQAMLAGLEARDAPLAALDAFFDNAVADTLADDACKGCFLFNTALNIGAHDDEVQGIVRRGIGEIQAFFRRCVEVGQARGEISRDLDAAATAHSLLGMTVAIRVLGRGVYTEPALRALAGQARRLVQPAGAGA
ncbi:MAG: TetR/AcrR family transcriptional regulator [Pseudomonadota bacterium]